MDHVRVGGVCLLLLVIAAALPINVLAQTPQPATSDNAANGAAPIISQSLLSKSTQGETISAENLAKRNTGLKPLASAGQTSKSEASAPPEVAANTAASAPESNVEQAIASQPPAQDVTITPDAIQTEVPAASNAASNNVVETDPATEAAADATVTPPENIALGTAVSADTKALGVDEQQNESLNETQFISNNVSANDSENATEGATIEPAKEADEDELANDRIWREGISPDEYTWSYKSFSGFFYDMKNDVGTERLKVKLQGTSRSIDSGELTYSTSAEETDFEFGDWGTYQVIGFMADKYFAGYKASDLFDRDVSLINDGQLRRVLIDSDDESTITTGSVLSMEEGYELRIKQIDIDGNKVYLALARNGEEVDSKVVTPDSSPKSATYEYKVDISGEDVPIVMAHISNVFASTESDLVTVDGLFQLSDTFASVESGDEYDKMIVSSVSDAGVEMENDNSLTLRKGSTTKIFGEVGFLVADAEELRFAPVVERSGPQEVRGTVIDPSDIDEFTWTVYNFEGFYYDIDDDVGTEILTAKISSKNKIEEKDLTYSTSPQPVKFEFGDWGKYDVIGFMADKYFAGYNNETAFTDEISAINEGQLRRVLIDSEDSQTIASGSVLSLEEGYEMRIKSVDLNGNKVYLSLAKDGEEVDSKVVTPSSDSKDRASNYMYKVDIGSEKDVPIITVHIESVFRSTESDLATVNGIFQVSDSPQSVEEGEIHGRMKVETLGDDGITMQNDGSISLGRGKTIEIMENLKLEVADSDKRLMAPIATKQGEGEEYDLERTCGCRQHAGIHQRLVRHLRSKRSSDPDEWKLHCHYRYNWINQLYAG